MVCILRFRGWRGRIGRSLPDAFWEMLLVRWTRIPVGQLPSIQANRNLNIEGSRAVASTNGINFELDPVRHITSVSKGSWQRLSSELKSAGYELTSLPSSVVSYGSLGVWSVQKADTTPKKTRMRNAGLGALWAVYPNDDPVVPDVQDFIGPVDAVYTWVDSEDPEWRASYPEFDASIPAGNSHSSNRDLARYTSRDELKYSLRSLELNAPWIRKIYLVTAGQAPDWLDTTDTNLVLVDHSEIFDDPETSLPTFNSHAIETQLCNIQGLSEHFIYVNDDIFFGSPLSPNVFFTGQGHVKYSLANAHYSEASNPQLAVNLAAQKNSELLQAHYGRNSSLKFRHVAHPQRKRIHKFIREAFSKEVEATAHQKFRHEDDISVPSSLAHYVAATEGIGVPVVADYTYIDLGHKHLSMVLFRLVRGRLRQMFCLNEVSSVDSTENKRV